MKTAQKHWFVIGMLLILAVAFFARFWRVTSFPPSLYWEEIALGYDAYSVLKTGHDHLGNIPSVVAFESYGDYKPALYFYLLIPSLAVFGLNEFAVRLPTMIAGILLVIGSGYLARVLFLLQRRSLLEAKSIQLLTMLVISVSPWAILFSRAAWEVNVATCFVVWGVACGLQELLFLRQKKTRVAVLSFLFFGLAMYTYHSTRVIAPLLAAGMMLLWLCEAYGFSLNFKKNIQKIMESRKVFLQIFAVGIFFLVLITPILFALNDPTTKERLAETSLFGDQHIITQSNALKESLGNVWWSKILYHRYVLTTKEFAANYLTHFSFQFLFVTGDQNLRHSVQYFGQLYLFEIVFLFFGLMYCAKHWSKELAFLLFWLVIGIVPAGLTKAAPHALRILPTMPVFILFISFGIWQVYELLLPLFKKRAKFFFVGVVVMYAVAFTAFWHFYATVYPKMYSGAWQYGYRQVIEEVERRRASFKNVFFTRELDRPGMAYWFFTQTDPHKIQGIDRTLQRDVGPYLQYENITFINFIGEARSGLVASSQESLERLQHEGKSVKNITEIKDLNGKIIWDVYELE